MNQYEKLRLVGRGAYGTAFLCIRMKDDQRVILKEIPVDQMSVDERQASVNEAKVLSMLDHPNIVGYYESFLEEETMTIVMEYVQGGTLFDFLKQRDGALLEEKEVLHYFGQMVYTLQYVHNKLILHRDLKSQNILLNSNKSVVKIGDFGISKVLNSKSKAYTVVGTPCYISPELCEGKSYNQKSDIWALGCILYELMTLKRPFDGTTLPAIVMKIMKGIYDPVPDVYSSELKKLLMSMLHLDPNLRPNAAEIMSQPFMINVIFKLYVSIGSIPRRNRSKNLSKSPDSRLSIASSGSENDSFFSSVRPKQGSVKVEENSSIWFVQSSSPKPILLPSIPKTFIKCVSLGANQKIGVTTSGLVINWQILSPHISIQNVTDNQEFIHSPSYVASIIDERLVVRSSPISVVVSGNDFTLCLSDSGVVFSFGKASSKCLGHSANKDYTEPQIVQALFSHNIISIACGPNHALAVSDEHKVFSWGCDSNGCLGLGKSELQILPKEVDFLYENQIPEKVFCGPDCSFIVTSEKSLLACGSNRHNKLALDSGEVNHIEESSTFKVVDTKNLHKNIKSVSSGKNHSVILCSNGTVYSVGSNQFFQLGWGQLGLNYSLPGKVKELENLNILQVGCGDFFTLAVTDDNNLYCWGRCPKSLNAEEEFCGVKFPPSFKKKAVLSVACDSENCLIVTKDA